MAFNVGAFPGFYSEIVECSSFLLGYIKPNIPIQAVE